MVYISENSPVAPLKAKPSTIAAPQPPAETPAAERGTGDLNATRTPTVGEAVNETLDQAKEQFFRNAQVAAVVAMPGLGVAAGVVYARHMNEAKQEIYELPMDPEGKWKAEAAQIVARHHDAAKTEIIRLPRKTGEAALSVSKELAGEIKQRVSKVVDECLTVGDCAVNGLTGTSKLHWNFCRKEVEKAAKELCQDPECQLVLGHPLGCGPAETILRNCTANACKRIMELPKDQAGKWKETARQICREEMEKARCGMLDLPSSGWQNVRDGSGAIYAGMRGMLCSMGQIAGGAGSVAVGVGKIGVGLAANTVACAVNTGIYAASCVYDTASAGFNLCKGLVNGAFEGLLKLPSCLPILTNPFGLLPGCNLISKHVGRCFDRICRLPDMPEAERQRRGSRIVDDELNRCRRNICRLPNCDYGEFKWGIKPRLDFKGSFPVPDFCRLPKAVWNGVKAGTNCAVNAGGALVGGVVNGVNCAVGTGAAVVGGIALTGAAAIDASFRAISGTVDRVLDNACLKWGDMKQDWEYTKSELERIAKDIACDPAIQPVLTHPRGKDPSCEAIRRGLERAHDRIVNLPKDAEGKWKQIARSICQEEMKRVKLEIEFEVKADLRVKVG